MRVLVMSNNYPPYHGGGYGLHCSWYCEELFKRGHDIVVLTSASRQGDVKCGLLNGVAVLRELKHISDDCSVFSLLRDSKQNVKAVEAAIKRYSPDVIYCHGIDGVGFNTYLAATGAGVPSFTTVGDTWLSQCWRNLPRFDRWTGIALGGNRAGFAKLLKRTVGAAGHFYGLKAYATPPRFHPVGCISKYLLDDLTRAGAPTRNAGCVIAPMLPRAYFHTDRTAIGHSGERTSHLRALMVGRLSPEKGIDVAIHGVAIAVKLGSDISLTVVGHGTDAILRQLESLTRDLDVSDRVTFQAEATTESLPTIYSRHDVLLFPSRANEGFGLVNAEAMACGVPVIGTAHAGSAEAIVEGVTGLRIAKDDFEALAARLIELQNDRLLLRRLSQAAVAYAQRHHPDIVLNRIENCLCRSVEGLPVTDATTAEVTESNTVPA
jgi:glycosyltransferase involved in cell wall biosynthesis